MSEKETYLYSRMNSKGFIMIAVFLHLNKQGVSRHIYALRIKLWVLLGWAFSISPFLAYAQLTGGTISTTACQTYNAAHSIVQATPISGEDGTQVITYSWERSTDAFVTFTTTGGSTTVLSDNYTLSGTTYYRRRVDNAGNTAYSNTVIISPKPDVTNIIPSSPNICFGQTSFPVTITALFGPDEYEILWNAGPIALANVSFAPNNFPLGGSINVQVVPNAPIGTYTGTLTLKISSTGCTFTGIPAAAIINPVPTVIVANPSAVCAPLTIDLASAAITSAGSTAGLSYTKWVNALATTPLTNANAVTVTGTYYIKGTNPSTGCSIIKPVMATINPLPTVVITNPLPVCAPLTIDFTSATITSSGSTAGLSYTQWINALATTPLINANVVTATGTYYVKGTNPSTGCRIIKPVTATINPLPTVVITNPLPVCAPLTIDLTSTTITSSGSTVGLSYTQWINALATIPLINANAVTATGTYYIKGTIPATGCSVIQSVTATINPLPIVVITNPSPVCAPLTIDLTSATITSSGSTVGLSYTQWINALATTPLTNASAVTATGTYYIKGTNPSTGCSVTQPVTVTINPLPTVVITNPSPVCAALTIDLTSATITSSGSTVGLSYTQWINALATTPLTNASAVTATGTYYIKGTNPSTGCSVIQPVIVTINPQPAVSPITGATVVCVNNSTKLSSATIGGVWSSSNNSVVIINAVGLVTAVGTGSATINYTVTNGNGCINAAITSMNVLTVPAIPTITASGPTTFCNGGSVSIQSSSGTSNQWYKNGVLIAGQTNQTYTATTSGIYTVSVSNGSGCVSNSSSFGTGVTVNPLPTVTVTNPAAVCFPGTIDLTAANLTTGSTNGLLYTQWVNALATTPLTNSTTVTIMGTYYIKGTNPSTGCSVIQPVTATINPLPAVIISNPPAICSPGTFDLTSTNITIGSTAGLVFTQWINVSATTALTNANTVSISGLYFIKGTIPATGCGVVQPVSVTINPLPTGAIQKPVQNYICEGTPTVLTVISNADGYQWYINQKNIPGATGVNYAAIAAGNYGVRFISKEGCTDTTINTTQLALFIKPLLEFIPDKQCLSNPVLFINRSSSNSSGNISWQWDFGDGTNSTLFSPSHIYPAESMYQITLTANNISCPNLTEKLILSYFIESPIPGIRYAEVSAIANQPTVIIARPFGAKYLWKPFNNLNSFTTQSPTVKLTAEQTYTVDITSAEGCVTTDTVLVKIILGSEIYVPQGFTPNGDRQNDRLYPIMEGMKGLTYFKVFNRWGNLVFQVNDAIPANGWNGKFNGIDQPAGSYAWIAEAVDVNGNTIRRSGSVLLIR